MADIKALLILSEQIKAFKKVSDPPTNYDALDSYETIIKQVCIHLH